MMPPASGDGGALAAAAHWAPSIPFAGVFLAGYPALNALVALNAATAVVWDTLRVAQSAEQATQLYAAATGCGPEEAARPVAAAIEAWRAGGLLASPPPPPIVPLPAEALPPTARSWSLDSVYAPFGPRVRLRVEPPSLAAALEDLLIPAVAKGREHAHTIELTGDAEGVCLVEDGVPRPPISDPVLARGNVVNALLRIGPLAARWQALLHGACLVRGEATIALFAPSGSGKSTLAADLMTQGWQLVSDDVVALEAGSLQAHPVPFKPSLKSGSWSALAPWLPGLANAAVHRLGSRIVRYAPLGPGDIAAGALRPTLLLFPRFVPDAPPSRTRLPPLEVLARLTDDASWIDLEPSRFAALLDWLATTPAHAITYPDAAVARAMLAEALADDSATIVPALPNQRKHPK